MRTVSNASRYSRFLSGMMVLLLLGLFSACRVISPGKIDMQVIEDDFGTIPNTNAVTKVYELRNIGDGVLKVTGLSTSCGCTTADLSKDTLEPGEIVNLIITFDPTTHNGATGQFMRQVFIQSTDLENPETVFTFRITVVEE